MPEKPVAQGRPEEPLVIEDVGSVLDTLLGMTPKEEPQRDEEPQAPDEE